MVWYKDVPNDFDVVVVLGGMAAPGKKPDDRTHFPGSPDRLLHAFQLYKLGKAKNILISGGSGDLLGKRIPEAQYLANVLMLCDMDTTHLWFESKSKNTRENALFTKELLEKKINKEVKLLLVTSAWHMRRSVGCYEKAGMKVTPFSVDAKIDHEASFWFSLVPNPNAPGKWQVLIHEVIGYLTYKMVGYV